MPVIIVLGVREMSHCRLVRRGEVVVVFSLLVANNSA